jgi:hypothetical protein
MTHNIWLALPSLTAILILAWIFIRSDKFSIVKESKPLALLFLSLAGISSIELGTYTSLLNPSLMIMKLYYVSCFLGLSGIFLQAEKVSGVTWLNSKKINYIITFSGALLISLMIGTNLLISGFEFIGYSYTRETGQFYWLVQIYIITLSIFSVSLLVTGTKNENKSDCKRAKLLLVSITPLLVIGIVLISLMQAGIQINASVIFQVFVTYFLIVILHSEKDASLYSLLIKLPFSKEGESLKQITNEIQHFLIKTELSYIGEKQNTSLSLKSLTTSIENLIVDHAVELNQGSQVKAASLLGVSSSSICRKKKKN